MIKHKNDNSSAKCYKQEIRFIRSIPLTFNHLQEVYN